MILDLHRRSLPDHNCLLQPDCSRIATTPIAALASMLEIALTISHAPPYSVITRDGMVTQPPVQLFQSRSEIEHFVSHSHQRHHV